MSESNSKAGNSTMNGHKKLVEEVQIPVPWGHISGTWWGSKDVQPLVALHGWQDNAGSFDKLAELLLPDIAVLSLDLPGHGFSCHLPQGRCYYLFWEGVKTLRRIVKHYKWDKVKLLGHSLGGAISFLYAGIFPKEVELLICLDIASPNVTDLDKLVESTASNIDKFLLYETLSSDNVPGYDYEQMVSVLHDAYNGSINRESAEILMKRGAQQIKLNKYAFSRDPRLKVSILGAVSMDMILKYASRIECLYLNIRATSGYNFGNSDNYKKVLDTIKKTAKKFVYCEVEGTHHVHMNNPEKVAPIIKDFLNS